MQNNKKPWFILISGPNGAGKTTFYNRIATQSLFFKQAFFANQDIEFAELINKPENAHLIDQTTKKFYIAEMEQDGNSGQNGLSQLAEYERELELLELKFKYESGKIVLNKIYDAFSNGDNLIFETTGAGRTALSLINKAKNLYGYNVCSLHPYVLDPAVSIYRVSERVKQGGHDVPPDVIIRRYKGGLNNLPEVLSSVNIGCVMDNSDTAPYKPIFMVHNGFVINFAECPDYLKSTHDIIMSKFPEKNLTRTEIKNFGQEQREIFKVIQTSKFTNYKSYIKYYFNKVTKQFSK